MNANLRTRSTKYDSKTYFCDLKDLNLRVAKKLRSLSKFGYSSYEKIDDCCSNLALYKNKVSGDLRLMRHRCRDRFCPICNHVTSTMYSTFLNQDFEKHDPNTEFYIALTFTCKSCGLEHLHYTLKTLSSAFSSWHKNYIRVMHYVSGLRTLEFTYNKDTKTFHPHIHCILKFREASVFGLELKKAELQRFDWGKSFARYLPSELCGWSPNSAPQYLYSDCDQLISYIKQHDSSYDDTKFRSYVHPSVDTLFEFFDPERSTLFEFSKYITKFNDLLDTLTDSEFVEVYKATKSIRVRQTLAEWRSWKSLLELSDSSTWIGRDAIRQNANWVLVSIIPFGHQFDFFVPCINDDRTQFLVDQRIIRLIE